MAIGSPAQSPTPKPGLFVSSLIPVPPRRRPGCDRRQALSTGSIERSGEIFRRKIYPFGFSTKTHECPRAAGPTAREKGSSCLFRRFGIGLQRRAGADQVAVAIDVVDPPDRRPVFVHPE